MSTTAPPGQPAQGPPPNEEPPEAPRGPLGRLARSAWQYVLLAGVLALLLGIAVLAWPAATLLVAGVCFGLYLLFGGITQIVAAFGTHGSTGMRVLAFISGALSILLGVFCFRSALQSVLLLALWIGIGWLFRGITLTVAAVSDEAMPARGWQVFTGVISAIAGIVILVSPLESVAVLTVLGGCMLIVVGIVEIITSFQVRARAKRIPPGV